MKIFIFINKFITLFLGYYFIIFRNYDTIGTFCIYILIIQLIMVRTINKINIMQL